MFCGFDTDVACEYGVNGAIMISNLQFWIMKNKANDKHLYDGHYWCYNSYKAFSELIPFMSQKTVRTVLNNLVDKGVVITGNYNKSPYDRTLWYAFADEEKWLKPNGKIDLPKSANESDQMGTPIPVYNTVNNIEKEINNNKLLFTKKKSKYSIQDIKYYWLPIANKWKLPTVETWSDKRNSELTARLKELDLDIETFFTKLGDLIAVSPFLRGKRWTHDPDGKSRLEDGEWRGSIDFFLSPSGCSKTFEGKYSERSFLNRDGTVPHFNYERGDKC